MNRIAFVTHCSDDWFYDGGCNKLLATAKYYNPTVPFYVFNNLELNKLNSKYNNKLHWDIMNPVVSKELCGLADIIIHIDADSIILAPLEDLILSTKESVLCVRNNNDWDKASRECDPPVTVNGCPPEQYMNAGFIGSRDHSFWDHWIDQNFLMAHKYPMHEQDVLNIILQNNKYSYNCLDSKESKRHLGISSLYGTETFWDNSKDIEYKDHKFYLNDKQIMVYHQAGGHRFFPKLQLDKLFNTDTADKIRTIINSVKVTYEKIVL